MKAVYEVPYAIPELGAEAGDLLVVRPADPDAPLLVVKEFDRNRLPLILGHVDHCRLVSFEGAPSPPPSSRRWLRSHLALSRPSHLRAV